ncbi:unnamed protein product, partial [Rotaria sordida]
MVSAAYLTKYFSRITIIESDDVLNDTLMKATPNEILDYRCSLENPGSIGRSGIAQIYQAHILEGEGFKIFSELFPRLYDKLFNEYNVRTYSLKNECRFTVNGTLLNQNLTEDMKWLGVDRFTLEIVLRKELCLQFGNQIEWKCKSRVTQLLVDQSLNMVKGVKYRCKENTGSSSFDMYGDFIIDCSGRNSSSTKWLKESLNLTVPTVQIHFGCGYVTYVGERYRTGNPSLDLMPVVFCTANTPDRNVGCYAVPIRTIKPTDTNSLGILSTNAVYCVNSEFSPNDSYENLLEWAKENLDFEYYTMLKATKVCGPLVSYRRVIDDRKYVELLGKKWPQNYILLGDSMCTFNPVFGQGMTHACRQARELTKIFAENCHKLRDISHIYNSRASVISEECWLLSTTTDWKTPALKVIETKKNGQIKIYERDGDFVATKNDKPPLPFKVKFLQ